MFAVVCMFLVGAIGGILFLYLAGRRILVPLVQGWPMIQIWKGGEEDQGRIQRSHIHPCLQ